MRFLHANPRREGAALDSEGCQGDGGVAWLRPDRGLRVSCVERWRRTALDADGRLRGNEYLNFLESKY